MKTDDVLESVPAKPSCCGGGQSKAPPPQRSRSDVLTYVLRYQPIIAITGAALLGSLLSPSMQHAHGGGIAQGLSIFMGLFLFPLALLKLFDIRGFAAAFARYDIVAKSLPAYGLAYPFIELALSLGFLSGLWPNTTHNLAMLIGLAGTFGIVRTLSRGERVQCACVGSTINLPLGVVSIMENAGMAAMAAYLSSI